jgi:hypothetical protein
MGVFRDALMPKNLMKQAYLKGTDFDEKRTI